MADKISTLVVEDEPLILMDVADQLDAEGYSIYQASNADEAIELFVAHPESARFSPT